MTPELLAPAGSMEAVIAAVQNGADAVYFGFGDFNARRGAKNFTETEFAAAVAYCHLWGVKAYLTLNTLLTDRELPQAVAFAARASAWGTDGAIIQDVGLLRAVKQSAPDLPLHASTQMTVHSLEGVKLCADLGFKRCVLSRELPASEIAYICAHAPIEIEVFAHGALCVCYSGQCFFSAVLGERSGNRGMCAQPCRMKYGWDGQADGFPLSLKELCLAKQICRLREMGVACLKLEGRMKRPEYVAVVTRVYAALLKENRLPTAEEMADLETAFSRNGFTDGYFQDRPGPEMFGTRAEKQPEPKGLFARAKRTYEARQAGRVPVKFYAMVRAGEPVRIGVEDPQGRTAEAAGEQPEMARTAPLTVAQLEKQLARLGGTPYVFDGCRALIENNLSVPLSAINALRRETMDSLSALRQMPPPVTIRDFQVGVRYANPTAKPELAVSVRAAGQLSADLFRLAPALLYVPVGELTAHPEKIREISRETLLAAVVPRVVWDRELPEVLDQLRKVRDLGCKYALIGNPGMVLPCRALGFSLRADYGLPVFNAQALKEWKRMGFCSATVSFELKLAQIRDISKAIPTEAIIYGRLPLMIIENRLGRSKDNILIDRRGERFPVVRAPGNRSEILNSKKLFLADKRDWEHVGLTWGRLCFTTENPWECVQVVERYMGKNDWLPNDLTRGLYYRGVE